MALLSKSCDYDVSNKIGPFRTRDAPTREEPHVSHPILNNYDSDHKVAVDSRSKPHPSTTQYHLSNQYNERMVVNSEYFMNHTGA